MRYGLLLLWGSSGMGSQESCLYMSSRTELSVVGYWENMPVMSLLSAKVCSQNFRGTDIREGPSVGSGRRNWLTLFPPCWNKQLKMTLFCSYAVLSGRRCTTTLQLGPLGREVWFVHILSPLTCLSPPGRLLLVLDLCRVVSGEAHGRGICFTCNKGVAYLTTSSTLTLVVLYLSSEMASWSRFEWVMSFSLQ